MMEHILDTIRSIVGEKGLEVYPFKIKWYNYRVLPLFHLPYHEDTLAVLLISTPSMFESLLLPFILSDYIPSDSLDPIDQCFKVEIFTKLQSLFPQHKTCFIQDYEIGPNRRPKILLQTVGHISGSAYYYQRGDVPQSPWPASTNMYGVSVHPKYGGWFAFRGVLIFQDIKLNDEQLSYKEPPNCITERERVIELLEKFNYSWQDWSYRDVLDAQVMERYSEQQKEYFATIPRERKALVDKWIEENEKKRKETNN